MDWQPPSTRTRITDMEQGYKLAAANAQLDYLWAVKNNESNPCIETINALIEAGKAKRKADDALERFYIFQKNMRAV